MLTQPVYMYACSLFSSIAPKIVTTGRIRKGLSMTDSRRGSTAGERDIGADCWDGSRVACMEWIWVAAAAVLKTCSRDGLDFQIQVSSWSFHHLTSPSV